MTIKDFPEALRKFEIPGRVTLASGNGGLPRINITTDVSTAEIYVHGGHITAFQKKGEPPLLFMSAKSHFAAGDAIRGGVPICFPWFGPRAGEPAHGLARLLTWELTGARSENNGSVSIRLRLPQDLLKPEWSALRTEFNVTIADTLAMELTTTNESPGQKIEIENCLHSYFHVSDINGVSIKGLGGSPFDDFAAGAAGARQSESDAVLRIKRETNRVYPDATGMVEIHDEKFRRIIRIEKSGSKSTVVWNPWTTQKLPDDFDPSEHQCMVCVESGNVKQNRISLAPGEASNLKVILSSRDL